MKVFVSWSGEVSHAVALALRDWLPNVIQVLKPFVSSEDIAKGGRWLSRIHAELEGAGFGIICLTPHNLQSAWVLFEAGAVAIRFAEGRVAPLLIGLDRAQVTQPLAQFQFTEPTRPDLLKLVNAINACLGENMLPADRLSKAFDVHWTELEAVLADQSKRATTPAPQRGLKPPPKRDLESMVAEVLDLVRSMQRQIEVDEPAGAKRKLGILEQAMREATAARDNATGALHRVIADRGIRGALGIDEPTLQRIIAEQGVRGALGDTLKDALGDTARGALEGDDSRK